MKKEVNDFGKEQTFEDFINKIEELVENRKNKKVYNALERIDFKKNEIQPNIEYFRFCYNFGDSPEDALIGLPEHENELFRKIENFSNKHIKKEFEDRLIEVDLSRIPDYELLDALNRGCGFGYEYGKIDDFDTQNLINELATRNDANLVYVVAQYGKFRQALGQLLNISNDFAYSNDELIELVKENLNK